MIKRAQVLKVLSEYKSNLSYDDLYKCLAENGLDLPIYPEYSEVVQKEISRLISYGTLFCVTQNTDEEIDYAFICNPALFSNIAFPVKPGEDIWYFEDNTFSEADIEYKHSAKFFWLSKVIENKNSHSANYNFYDNQEINFRASFDNVLRSYLKKYDNARIVNKALTQHSHTDVLLQGIEDNFIILDENGAIDIVSKYDYGDNENEIETGSRISLTYEEEEEYNNVIKLKQNIHSKFKYDNEKIKIKSYESNFNNKVAYANNKDNRGNYKKNEYIDNDSCIEINSRKIKITGESSNASIDIYRGDKISKSSKDYSCFALDNNNNIIADGKTLYLGNFNRFLVDNQIIDYQSLIESNSNNILEDFSEDQHKQLMELSGKGSGVLIGYDTMLSEPLVLGNSLSILLKDIIELISMNIEQNKTLLKELKNISEEYKTHTHNNNAQQVTVAPPTGVGFTTPLPTLATTDISKHQNFINATPDIEDKHNRIQKDLEKVKGNLKYILSKFAKTT